MIAGASLVANSTAAAADASPSSATGTFGASLAAALEQAANSVRGADSQAQALAAGQGDVVTTSIARAKADVALEIAAVAASRVSNAVSTLMQTQI